ncbi:sphingosine-1-phosphate lyase 1 [Saitoella complicata NRRL Y-17804]|uniref:sphinganine-1-phosphate aldolase n=1 Tax=Saitoella complicata (strain BCRC 22490 / CBS 7301 / JCM 7358 / NBRC 10748 / NRRL Y-17804) TaxID=698492 RepID=A0A0E9NDL1_SAICN|nr:sphingosine-1-phosphate lyase 1 [Saitoella complicata NRRL Y-17804]ODQ50684.1 sphingosine-1-phosphate lyase 1 [Saitoella complicata NRRL Y-17804]GAO47937.1 hypothetical protein G7K_2132-t1 [Saitoella complicata NRRL Y-17804]
MSGVISTLRTQYPLGLLKNVVFTLWLLRYTTKAYRHLIGRGLIGSVKDIHAAVTRWAWGLLLKLPSSRKKIEAEIAGAKEQLEMKLVNYPQTLRRFETLPSSGLSENEVREELQALLSFSSKPWSEIQSGQVSGAVYHGGSDLSTLTSEAYSLFSLSNPLHPDIFPAVRKMEAEIVSMVLRLFNAPDGAGGAMTSGGTESILMAVKGAREMARVERRVREPEMIVPRTGHAAFDKAGHYFGVKVWHVDVDPITYKVNIADVRRLINPNTILLVGSAPNFPHGIIDDIAALSDLAVRYEIPLHVDCCLGSFIVPFLERAGFASEPFDFRLRGVTSISCDTHKYGFAPKGTSTILYRSHHLRQYQYFVSTDWPGGVYASPSIAGSRPGALLAGCWAAMVRVGEEGYLESCKEIVGAAKGVEAGLMEIDGIQIIGKPLVSVVAFTSTDLNIYEIGDELSKRGWHLNALQSPPALHIACTRLTVPVVDKLVQDVRDAVQALNEEGREKGSEGSMMALYGSGVTEMPDKSVVRRLATVFVDTLYKA